MNDLMLQEARSVAEVSRPNLRAVAKQRTREKILDSARVLFAERGYEGATIRDIAHAVGLSTGAVFNNFDDKFTLFAEIIGTQRRALYETMRASAGGATVHAALRGMFTAGYRSALEDLPLLQAATSVSWTHDLGARVREGLARWPVADLVADVLTVAVGRGELAADTKIRLISQVLWDCFLNGLGQAAFSGWRLDELTDRLMDVAQTLLPTARVPGVAPD